MGRRYIVADGRLPARLAQLRPRRAGADQDAESREEPGDERTVEQLPPVGSDHACLLAHVVADRLEQLGAGQPGACVDLGIERVEPEVVVALGRQGAVVPLVAKVVPSLEELAAALGMPSASGGIP
jgi:hypothetical protein